MNKEYWYVWDQTTQSFFSRAAGMVGDHAMQQPGADRVIVLVSEASFNKPELEASDLIGPLLEKVSARFAIEVDKGCPSAKGRVHCDDAAQIRILGAIRTIEELRKRGVPIEPTKWTMWDGSKIEHSDLELVDLGLAISLGFGAKFSVKQDKEEGLKAPTATIADIMAVAINIGASWPA